MAHQRFLKRKVLKSGQVVWSVNPSQAVRDALGYVYEQYPNRADAVCRASEISTHFDQYRRDKKSIEYVNSHSVAGLVSAYKQTNSWDKLSDNSKRTYNQLLNGVLHMPVGQHSKPLNEMLVSTVSVQHAEKIYSNLKQNVSMHRANHTCKVLRRLWKVGDRLGLAKENPFSNMGLQKLKDRVILWTPEDVEKIIKVSDENNYPSIGTLVLLCYDLCQRPGDMRQLTWDNYFPDDGHGFAFVQEKTDTPVEPEASDWLIERLRNTRRVNTTNHIVYYENTGKPYDRWNYNMVFRRLRDLAKLPKELQLRDLRRTGATEMAESGCTEDELRAITGHQSRDILSIYVRPTKKLARAGQRKRYAAR